MVNENNLSTIRDLIRHATTTFAEHKVHLGQGTETHFDEACFLVLRTLSLPLNSLDIFLDATLTPPEILKTLQHIERRTKNKVPAAYILNEAWLRDYKFYVNEDVLIPRSHIADLLFDQVDVWITNHDSVKQVLDLCTGSGCLAILAAHQFPNAKVAASDLSKAALSICAANIESYELADQITCIQSDLFSDINQQFDLIISNPPYVDQKSIDKLPPEFQMEPKIALAGGEEGIDLVQQIIREAPAYLAPNGILISEVGRNRAAIEAKFPKVPFTWIETQSGRDFVFLLSRKDLCIGLAG
ncbi:MAG: 50S ribosomal protein L3 N(5)-glutamine methyltransferase [Proteobacteria bacterium]|nr:50S ribosomal protein L3 N(5)-glutamine methyltransferase [Pseudomonadota bacterium]